MKRAIWIVAMGLVLLGTSAGGETKVYPNRWVRIGSNLGDDRELDRVRKIITTASEHGLNGVALSAGLDGLDVMPGDRMRRLKEVQRICAERHMEIIPLFMSAGYGGAILAHDKNLAAGLAVRDALFVVKGGQAGLVADPEVGLVNAGFERSNEKQIAGFEMPGKSAEGISVDTLMFKEGNASVRFEDPGQLSGQDLTLSQETAVHPYRCYRLSCWIRSENMASSDPFGSGYFRLDVKGVGDERRLQYENPKLQETAEWYRVAVGFNTWGYEKVRISAIVEKGTKGKFWLDDLRLEEVGLVNTLRRPGAPLVVRGETSGTVYEERRDYDEVVDANLNFRFDHDGPAIRITAQSRIREGERLRVSWYHGVSVYRGQTPLCMSEPKLYDLWRAQARLVHETLAPKKYLLSQDEIRVGGSCEACRSRGMTMGQVLGDCITRQFRMLRDLNPAAEIFVWSDMLDPNHNAKPSQKYYYLAEGTFVDSWKYIPKELRIACWYYDVRDKSLPFFSALGFQTLGAAYYDADNLDNPKGWLESLDATPGACGIMYTTWLNKYELLGPFGDLVSRR
jgi:hypothetical protein